MNGNRFFLILAAPLATSSLALAEPETVATQPAPTTHTTDVAAPKVPTSTLEQALLRLEEQNYDVKAAQSRVDEASAVIKQARAPMLPTVVATGSYVRNSDAVELRISQFLSQIPGAPDVPDTVIQPLDAWTASGTVRIPLFVPRAWHGVDAAKAGVSAARAATAVAKHRSRAALSQLAYGARALEQVVAASERAIELAQQHEDSAARRVASGTAAPLDVLRARAERTSRESDKARAVADLERTRTGMGVLLGLPHGIRIIVPEKEPGPPAEQDMEHTVENRPELAALAHRKEASREQVDAAKAMLWPELSATGSVFASDEPYPTGERTGYRVTVDLTLPLYDGGYRYGKRDEAEAQVRTAEAEEAALELSIRREIADARREVAVARERLRLAEVRAQLASDVAASAVRSFEAGVATSLDVLDANDKLYKADVGLAAERASLAQALIELRRVLGKP